MKIRVNMFPDLQGKVFEKVENLDNSALVFNGGTQDSSYVFFHEQDCCESVYIEDICGDLSDLESTPILNVEEVISNKYDTEDSPKPCTDYDSCTWTFYKFSTIKGSVTVRWFGESNGYYSESVDFGTYKEYLNRRG
jgi:hypothetical protein